MNVLKNPVLLMALSSVLVFMAGMSSPALAGVPPVSQEPLSVGVGQAAPPLNMLVMGRDHKLYYEAYNDASDLNGNGILDIGYKGHLAAGAGGIDYFGYFDSRRCYSYSTGSMKFTPGAAAPNKTCTNAWSGDFLNYLTTSRMDALRKVLYGGYRVVDEANATTLERAYIPQDAHTWGKEYTSLSVDGYDLRNYAPLSLPEPGNRVLFANATLRGAENRGPLLRVLTNSSFRIWEWVSRAAPVAGSTCGDGSPCETGGVNLTYPGHPRNRAQFDAMEVSHGIPEALDGTSTIDRIDCNSNNADCNPHGTDDDYMTIITGSIEIRQQGNYVFHIDGDDNIDFIMWDQSGHAVTQTGCYPDGRGFGACSAGNGALAAVANNLPVGTYSFKFRHEERGGGDGYQLRWERRSAANGGGNTNSPGFDARVLRVVDQHAGNGSAAANASGGFSSAPTFRFYDLIARIGGSRMTDFRVRVDVCVAGSLESNCKRYANGGYKPTGILHDYGESDRMFFGLLTGSYANNTQGGVLRKNMSSFSSEVNPANGIFVSGAGGIVSTIDALRVIDFNSDMTYTVDCGVVQPGWINDRPINNGECSMWGNPIAEMMYEALRYFSGAPNPRPEFMVSATDKDSVAPLSLPRPNWVSPYKEQSEGGAGYLRCATPVMTVISDINPSYDGQVPGGQWGALSGSGDPAPLNSLNVSTEVDAIWAAEGGGSRSIFIGESNGNADSAPTAKTVSNLRTVRGLSPEEPTKLGTYYSAGVARFGARNTIGGSKNAMTYAVALASPLPTFNFPVGGSSITLVPFAKTVYTQGWGVNIRPDGNFQPTNQIVDFYVETIANTDPNGSDRDNDINEGRPFAKFRINYEDVEQGADHDMDLIVLYTLRVTSNNRLQISLSSEFAAGGHVQYAGYVISGTQNDGVYLEVSDCDSQTGYAPAGTKHCGGTAGPAGGARYRLNTQPGVWAGHCENSGNLSTNACRGLPYETTREFTVANTASAELLNDPLWYAAKYGRPMSYAWDEDGNGEPDNYFLVTNAGTLKDQLDKAFAQIVQDTQNSGGVAASGARATVDLMAYIPEYTTTDWTGDLRAHKLDPATGALRPMLWSAKARLAAIPNEAIATQGTPISGRNVYYIDPGAVGSKRRDFTVAGLGGADEVPTKLGTDTVPGMTGATAESWVNYLRGDHGNEQASGGPFRNRSSRIGDIFSQPVVLDKASYGYSYLPEGGNSYRQFVANKEDRVAVAFVASNDGFLHAFNATDNAATGGRELFALAPAGVMRNMAQLGNPSYAHRFYVDGSPTQGDAYINGGWKTLLVGGLGAGGRSVYALDVTDPANGSWDVLWEYSDADLGLTMGSPKIARLPNGKWAAVFGGTGYATSNNAAHLYIVDLETGDLIQKIRVNDEGTDDLPNGIGTPAIIDLNGDGITDVVYAGDYYGNVWKFTLAASGGSLNVASSKLFTAVDTASNETGTPVRQPITGGVTASIHPVRGQLVFFGTGRYMLVGDNAAPVATDQIQTFYGIWDDNGATVSRDSLVEQTFISAPGGRGTSSNVVSWGDHKGWFIDLKTGNSGNGQRFIGQPTVALGRVFFTSFVSQGDECEPGGTNCINALWVTSGSGGLGD